MSIKNTFHLDGKTALVTGCKRGIGKAMAIALADAGADIIGVSATLENSKINHEDIIAESTWVSVIRDATGRVLKKTSYG